MSRQSAASELLSLPSSKTARPQRRAMFSWLISAASRRGGAHARTLDRRTDGLEVVLGHPVEIARPDLLHEQLLRGARGADDGLLQQLGARGLALLLDAELGVAEHAHAALFGLGQDVL